MHQHSHVVDEVFFALCKRIDSGISLGAWLRYKYAKAELVTMDIDPGWYNTAYDFARDYAVVSYLAKAEFLETNIKTDEVAIQRFRTAEDMCRETNRRFKFRSSEMLAFEPLLFRAQRKISEILGPLDVPGAMALCRWGPGGTYDISKASTGIDVKTTRVLSTTAGAYPYGKAWLETDPVWFEAITGHRVGGPYSALPELFSFTEENRVVVVPKNAKTGRTIASEPTWNSFIQQGFGRFIRRRLKRFGVELNNQLLNQSLAMSALSLELATIDLSMASDTVAREVVFSLLPYEWAHTLDDLRSKRYNDPETGKSHTYEKFSSMGNAFTFELESLIFSAALLAVYEEHTGRHISRLPYSCSVYGDDIICPSVMAPRLIEFLGVLGFKTNVSKTHLDGQFRESCGVHYFGGFDVTPVYQKRKLSGVHEIVRGGNRLFRLALRMGSGFTLDSSIFSAWAAMRRHAGRSEDCWIPYSERNDGWLAPADQRPGDKCHRDRGWRCKVISQRRRFRPAAIMGVYAHKLYLNSHAERHMSPISLIPDWSGSTLGRAAIRRLAVEDSRHTGVSPSDVAYVELEPRGLKISRRWVKSSEQDFEATWS